MLQLLSSHATTPRSGASYISQTRMSKSVKGYCAPAVAPCFTAVLLTVKAALQVHDAELEAAEEWLITALHPQPCERWCTDVHIIPLVRTTSRKQCH